MTKFKTMYADEVDLLELPVEIERFKGLSDCTKQWFHVPKQCHSIGCVALANRTWIT